MGKRGKRKEYDGNRTSTSSGFHSSLTLREEASGKKQSQNPKSILKLKHFQNLAQWSSAQLQSNQSGCLSAFYGRRFAEFGESLGVPNDPSIFPCQRCETILQPGFSCTVRIEKNRAKHKRHSKTKTATQNNVVYTCSFCSYRNLKRGTPRGYVREITHSKAIPSKPKSGSSAAQKSVKEVKSSVTTDKANEAPSSAISNVCSSLTDSSLSAAQKSVKEVKSNVSNVTTDKANGAPSSAISNVCSSLTDSSLSASSPKLLDSKRRKRKKPGPKESADEPVCSSAPAGGETCSGTSKRKKTWTSLKDIAEREKLERNQKFKNFSIPFVL